MTRHDPNQPCPHMEGLLNRTADGTAAPLARWYALAHAARCPGCHRFLDALQSMIQAMRRGRSTPSPDTVQRLTAIVHENAPS